MDRRIIHSKQRLKEALTRLILEDDFWALTIDQICQEAGCARSTFYSHYERKEQLLTEIIDEQVSQIKRLTDTRFDAQTEFYTYLQAFMTQFVVPQRALYQRLLTIEMGDQGFRQRLDHLYRELFLSHFGDMAASEVFSQYFSAMALTTTELMVHQELTDAEMARYATIAQQICQSIIQGTHAWQAPS